MPAAIKCGTAGCQTSSRTFTSSFRPGDSLYAGPSTAPPLPRAPKLYNQETLPPPSRVSRPLNWQGRDLWRAAFDTYAVSDISDRTDSLERLSFCQKHIHVQDAHSCTKLLRFFGAARSPCFPQRAIAGGGRERGRYEVRFPIVLSFYNLLMTQKPLVIGQ